MSSSAQNNQEKQKPIEDYLKKADILLDKRFLYFAFNCLGKNVEVQLENGAKGQGTFYTANIDHGGVVVKNFAENGPGAEAPSTKVLKKDNFVYLLVSNVEEPPVLGGKKDVFRTDTEISKKKSGGDRKLIKWNNEEPEVGESTGFVLEDMADQKGKWNQFEVNEKKFGLTSEFEESMYTTHLDMKRVPAALLAKASKLEEEILNDTTEFDSRHIREERGLEALKEDNEDEEFAYSSVIRTDSKTSKKNDKKAAKAAAAAILEEERKPKFFNSKRPGTELTSNTPPPMENKKDTKETPAAATLQVTKKDSTPNTASIAAADNLNLKIKQEEASGAASQIKPKEAEITPKASESTEITEGKLVSRQDSNLSEDPSAVNRTKPRLSLKATTFEAPFEIKPKEETKAKEEVKQKEEVVVKPKEEEKPKPVLMNQGSLEVDGDKKFSLNDYSSTAIAKFKLKVNEKEIKKSASSFYDYTVSNWQKKPAHPDPANINPSWKATKASSVSMTANKPASVSQTSTAKPFKPPVVPFAGGGMPPFGRPNDGMMYPQPFVNPNAFPPNPSLPYMPYQIPQKFTPAFPFPPQQQHYPFPQYVDPTQPSFNMSYQHNTGNNPRQGQMKNFNKNKN